MFEVHPTAIVEDGAKVGNGVRVGAFSIIGRDVELEDDVVVHSHAMVTGHTRIGRGTTIFPYAAVGGPPQDTSYRDEPTSVLIGEKCILREHVTVHRGTARGRGQTVIGAGSFLMIGAHVAHDCVIGKSVVLVNAATLAGHVEVGDHAILGGLSAIQQHCRVGAHAFIAGISGIATDVIPFASAIGQRAELGGLNIVGLKRRGFDRATIHALRAAYREIFGADGSRNDRVDRVAAKYPDVPAVMMIVDFIRKGGDRPLCSPRD
jgi:UDP-N-acetylglucosamine acyltransferase